MIAARKNLNTNAVVASAIEAMSLNDLSRAIEIIRDSRLQVDSYKLNYILGLCLLYSAQYPESVESIERALTLNPKCANSWCSRGMALQCLGKPLEALASFNQAVALRPAFPEAWSNRGVLLMDLGRHEEAIESCDRAIEDWPDFADAWYNRGVALEKTRRLAEAVAAYDRAVAARPAYPEAWYNRGVMLRRLGRPAEALASFDTALAHRADFPQALCDRGIALQDLKRPAEAVAAYEAALRQKQAYPEAWSNRGNALKDLGDHEAALASYDMALAQRPVYAEAWYNRGTAQQAMGRLEAAVASFETALTQQPHFAKAWSNHGFAFRELGRFEAALASYDKALAYDPHCAETHFNRGVVRLLTGDFDGGWADYEWRWQTPRAAPKSIQGAWPEWQGQPLAGRSLVVHAEQGLGDTIQFSRYLKHLHGGRVIFVVERKMHRLLKAVVADIDVRSEFASDAAADFQIPLMSLPKIAGTRLPTIPAPIPYLSAEEGLVERWRTRIGAHGFKIGICWHGNGRGKPDLRSLPLSAFRPIAHLPGVRLISLQKNHGLDQLDSLPAGMRIEVLGADFDEGPDAFLDTAAVMMSLDLVITSDTSVAHLAGALGRKVWLPLLNVPEWRWMLTGDSSPWYPTMRLFRQTREAGWTDVFDRMRQALSSERGGQNVVLVPESGA